MSGKRVRITIDLTAKEAERNGIFATGAKDLGEYFFPEKVDIKPSAIYITERWGKDQFPDNKTPLLYDEWETNS